MFFKFMKVLHFKLWSWLGELFTGLLYDNDETNLDVMSNIVGWAIDILFLFSFIFIYNQNESFHILIFPMAAFISLLVVMVGGMLCLIVFMWVKLIVDAFKEAYNECQPKTERGRKLKKILKGRK